MLIKDIHMRAIRDLFDRSVIDEEEKNMICPTLKSIIMIYT